jgi:hypothetical protein
MVKGDCGVARLEADEEAYGIYISNDLFFQVYPAGSPFATQSLAPVAPALKKQFRSSGLPVIVAPR